ncbi:DUF1613-domain-containing protein [Aspergillus heteromorphus CBS 117.55]|uniref:tRNA (uracil-O(2)-)-methyltransferase n=1 Tax=Aspergillus heteromorphus CBS 117.55 TaxID=1448321 RepID=A0A317WAB3_9EURO|nr:DUF1613-domain-containing protein [Aspergillus heteromorphus CBS 117.55]PWY83476.1 DUF1613-domain-containing protein [Aspergillus heteromorphus CBS 117.55]
MPRNTKKPPRDVSHLSGKPLAETLEPSPVLKSSTEEWATSCDLTEHGLPFTLEVIQDMALFLLANPNMTSSHLYRADILYDSAGTLRTPQQQEQSFAQTGNSISETTATAEEQVEPTVARDVPGFTLTRTVVRRLVPRNPNLDRTMDQTCHFYEASASVSRDSTEHAGTEDLRQQRSLVIYNPHVASKEDMPFYHPLLRSLAFLYDFNPNNTTTTTTTTTNNNPPDQTSTPGPGTIQNPNKDNVIPQHLVQNTYTRLKLKYASDLCQRWVESTEPSKHVFEDLSITAFLIELWRSMYGVVPEDEKPKPNTDTDTQDHTHTPTRPQFPGFIDIACGNGVLVYILLMEGYSGWGFDARRRKTWSIFPPSVQSHLKEEIYIPQPFAETIDLPSSPADRAKELGVASHYGLFPKDTFIISNHADELTVWTPLLATLLCPESQSPFIAIPCCSHALSGKRFRYPPPSQGKGGKGIKQQGYTEEERGIGGGDGGGENNQPQPKEGDLKSLRKEKQEAQTDAGFYKSMYGSLTAKTMSVARELGYGVERTLLRIPSTRNMAVIGGRVRTTRAWKDGAEGADVEVGEREEDGEVLRERVLDLVRRECAREGGVDAAAKTDRYKEDR